MSKYIIDLDYDLQRVVGVGVKQGTVWVKDYDVDDLEELNSDYSNEHYGDLQDTAYKRGVNDGSLDVKERVDGAYQKGLEDAWEAARKIVHMPEGDLLNIFTECYSAVCTALQVLLKYDASEAIEKLKAYEEKKKQDDEIKVGDEVDCSGDSFIVTRIFQPYNKAEKCDGVDMDGCTYHDVLISGLTKTGRHVDITDMLKGALE